MPTHRFFSRSLKRQDGVLLNWFWRWDHGGNAWMFGLLLNRFNPPHRYRPRCLVFIFNKQVTVLWLKLFGYRILFIMLKKTDFDQVWLPVKRTYPQDALLSNKMELTEYCLGSFRRWGCFRSGKLRTVLKDSGPSLPIQIWPSSAWIKQKWYYHWCCWYEKDLSDNEKRFLPGVK